jgi:type III restriction enzyme
LPKLSRRFQREFKDLDALDPAALVNRRIPLKDFAVDDLREIVFKTMLEGEKADGDLSTYTPDFLVKDTEGGIWIIETKGREELDLPQKMGRLRQWCADATEASREDGGIRYRFLYVNQEGFTHHAPRTLQALAASFTEYQETRA